MSTNTPAFTKGGMQAAFVKQFTYDQLNRIKTGKVIDVASNNAFATAYSYDANGNILTLERSNGAGKMFDQLAYTYHNVDKGYLKNTNKLRYVNDAAPRYYDGTSNEVHDYDIEDQGIDNYDYDEIGNLIKDEAEDIERIEWTVSGKVYAVIRKDESTKASLYFSYDAMGNRISKKSYDPVQGNVHTTYYFREASGNTMATYEKRATNSFTLTEQHIYGSSRLGMYAPSDQSIDDSPQESVTIDNGLLTSSY